MPKGPQLRLRVLVLLALASGCQSKSASEAKVEQAPTEARAPEPIKAAEGTRLRFKVDGKKLRDLQVEGDFDLLSIEALPPIDTWQLLVVHNVAGREFRATKPILLTEKRTMRVVRNQKGGYEFVVMQHGDGKDIVRHRMPDAKIIEIQTKGYTPPPQGAATTTLQITIGGNAKKLGPGELDAIKRTPAPDSEGGGDTWKLVDLLGKPALTDQQAVVLHKGSDSTLRLSAAQIADDKVLHLIKRNRRGKFHYRAFSLGDTPRQITELRGLKRIELTAP